MAEPKRQIALKLALDALNVQPSTQYFQDRLLIQKATYLAQQAGLNLGYRYNWYLKGPYSPGLTRDAFALAENPDIGGTFKLADSVAERLARVALVSEPPPGTELSRDQWLELLASLHYLVKQLNKNENEALAIIRRSKPNLAPHVPRAREALHTAQLL